MRVNLWLLAIVRSSPPGFASSALVGKPKNVTNPHISGPVKACRTPAARACCAVHLRQVSNKPNKSTQGDPILWNVADCDQTR